jgi:hypothetical protein
MTNWDLIKIIIDSASEYIPESKESVSRNRHMNELEDGESLQQRHIDAVVTDFINFFAAQRGCDLGLYTTDLRK